MIELLAYDTREHIVRGLVELRGDRMADLLIATDRELSAESGFVLNLRDGREGPLASWRVEVDHLGIGVATGPQGNRYRRVDVHSALVIAYVGRFSVCGHIHAPAPERPDLGRDVRPWFPITDAVVEYTRQGRHVRDRFDAVLVNRTHVTGFVTTDARAHDARWLASRPAAGPMDSRLRALIG